MVAPVTGPFSTIDYRLFAPPNEATKMWARYRTWYRQKKPFDLSLEYDKLEAWVDAKIGNAGPHLGADSFALTLRNNISSALVNEAKSKAWSQFVGGIGKSAQLGTSLAEGRQAMGMMLSRVTQLANFAKHLNRFEFEKARHDLNLPKKKSTDVWSRDRTVANNFLEVHFGWSPLISDIYDTMAVLTSPVKPHPVKGQGHSAYTTENLNWPPEPNSWSIGSQYRWRAMVQYHALLEVTNPNLALANRLGLINPASIAWELVPYSFVVDWFSNIGQTLSCMTDLMGYSTSEATTTLYTTVALKTTRASTNPTTQTGDAYSVQRTFGLSQPMPYLKPFKGFSLVRGITAMSLLIQKLPKRPADMATPSLRARRVYKWTDYAALVDQVPFVRKKP